MQRKGMAGARAESEEMVVRGEGVWRGGSAAAVVAPRKLMWGKRKGAQWYARKRKNQQPVYDASSVRHGVRRRSARRERPGNRNGRERVG